MSKYDPWVNMLRTTVAAFAAGVGGADAVTVLPFDSPLGAPDAFGRRIARNTCALLIDESHVAAVADPAGGAYAVEKLTDDLAVAAWELFGRLEDGAGPGRRDRARPSSERDREVATRKRPLTGLTEFPNLAETLPERAPAPASPRRTPLRRGLRGAARRPGRRARLPGDDGHGRRAHRARDVRRQPARRRRHRRRRRRRHRDADDLVAAYDGQRSSAWPAATAPTTRWARRARPRRCARPAPSGSSSPASRATGVDDSCRDRASTRSTFLTRTREKLA